MTELWKVTQDGRAIFRALSLPDAERRATMLAHGYDTKRAGSSIHHPHIEVRKDTDAMGEVDANHQWYKDNK